jgi:hypothetical protein
MTRLAFVALLLLLALVSACSEQKPASVSSGTSRNPTPSKASAATPQAADEIVKVSTIETKLRAGGDAEATVHVHIADGFHVNANPPSDKFYIGTQLTVQPQADIEPGTPIYPPALRKKFSFAPEPLAVYEGEPVIKLPLKASAAARGKQQLAAKLRVQPCNDEACRPPRDIQFTIPVAVN